MFSAWPRRGGDSRPTEGIFHMHTKKTDMDVQNPRMFGSQKRRGTVPAHCGTAASARISRGLKVLSIALAAGAVAACTNQFAATNRSRQKPLSPEETLTPKEVDLNAPPTREICTENHKAARLFFVVDNSSSHGYVVNGATDRIGTDPARQALSVRGKVEFKTFRQEALYTIARRTAELDRAAKQSNPTFIGTQIGISYFPRYQGSGNPDIDPGTMQDLATYINVTGPGGTGSSVFPDRLTDLAKLDFTAGQDDALWNSFSFTHRPGGSTPYATGLRAAVENFGPQTRSSGDTRENILFLLTDGLPTDETPSEVRRLRRDLGQDVRLVVLSVYDPNEDPTVSGSPLYTNLKSAFLGPQNWATKQSNPDSFPKSVAGFEQYWSTLLALPSQIADEIVKVPTAADLQGEIDRILEAVQTCRQE